MSNIWFSSDWHFSHSNICYGVSVWPDKETTTRRFDTLHEMNKTLINNINNCVQQDDVLYFLGDWSFNGVDNVWKLRRRINCQTIHFILGNHDQYIKKNREVKILKEDVCLLDSLNAHIEFTKQFNEQCIISVQDLFTSVSNYLEITIDKQIFILSHYPIDEWYEMDRGSIQLHGHCHHMLDKTSITNIKYRRMDIGIDWKEFRPYSLEEILKIMNRREIKKHTS